MKNERGQLQGKQPITYRILKVGNYLSNPGLVLSNVKPDSDGNINLEIPNSSSYSHIVVYVNDPMSCVSTEVPLASNPSQFIDTRLSKSKKEGLVYTETRYMVNLVEEGQRASVTDLDNTNYSFISSLSDLFSVQKLLAGYNSLNIKELEKWEFLTRWGSLTLDEKLEKYEEFQGHELHVFLYFKDVDFFSQYVSAYIENKSSKELVDHFLLGDSDSVKQLMSVQNFSQLNSLEIALGVLLLKSSDPKNEDFCISCLRRLEDLYDVQKDFFDEKGPQFKQRFDTVLFAVAKKDAAIALPGQTATTTNYPNLLLGSRKMDEDYLTRDRKMDAPKPYAANIKRRTSTCYMAEKDSMPKAPMKSKAPLAKKRQLSNASCSSEDQASVYSESDNCSDDEDDDDCARSRSMSIAYSYRDVGGLNLMQDIGVLRGKKGDFCQELDSPRVHQKKDGKTIEYIERHSYFANNSSQKPFVQSFNRFWIDTVKSFL